MEATTEDYNLIPKSHVGSLAWGVPNLAHCIRRKLPCQVLPHIVSDSEDSTNQNLNRDDTEQQRVFLMRGKRQREEIVARFFVT